MSARPSQLAGLTSNYIPAIDGTRSSPFRGCRSNVPIELDQILLADGPIRGRLDDVIHDVVDGIVGTEPSAARKRRELFAASRIGPHELAIRGEEIRVVVPVVVSGIHGEGVAADELSN